MKYFRDGLEIEAESTRTLVRDGHTCEVFKTSDGDKWFVTLHGTHFCAHGDSFQDAVLAAKEKKNPGVGKDDAIDRVKESGKITLTDFCLITGACRAGATMWAKEQGISPKESLEVKDALERLQKSSSQKWGERLKEELME